MRNFVNRGETITCPAPATVTSGLGYVLGSALFGVAVTDGASGDPVAFVVEGVVELPKHSTTVLAVGDLAIWDVSAGELIGSGPASGDISNVGIVIEAAGSGDTTAKVKLLPEKAYVYPNATDAATATSIANLNAWATALATKLNADAGVTDTNYDTNPQA